MKQKSQSQLAVLLSVQELFYYRSAMVALLKQYGVILMLHGVT